MNQYQTDLVIIGAGPSGLFSIFQAGMLKIKCHIIDSLEIIGGQCSTLYPEKPIYDIPACPKILASELIERLEAQAEPFSPFYHLNQRVEKFVKNLDNSFTVSTSKNVHINCKAIIIAAGCGAFGPHRPPLENIEAFEEKSVFYAVKNKSIFKDKIVAIAGGGDSAVDWAINLAEIAKKIFFIHRRNKFRAAPDSCAKLEELSKSGKVEMIVPFQLNAIYGNEKSGEINQIEVKDFDNNLKMIEANYLLPFFGLSMELGPIANWGLNLYKNLIDVDPATMETSYPNIYAVGDIAHYKNKLKLILTSFAEVASACHNIYKVVYPNEILHFEYSTSKGIK
jgi:thioredoxin reductase (NADPH)